MKIGVISDTHIINDPESVEKLCNLLEPHFKDVRLILHAGDIRDISLIENLERFANVYAVAGNTDTNDIYSEFGDRKIIEVNGLRIGLIHGWGAPDDLPLRVRNGFAEENPDCIVFGHSHYPYNRIEDNVLMFNPGSPVEPRYSSKRSIGILHVSKNIRGEHVTFSWNFL